MPDELRSPIKLHLVLYRIDQEQGIRRFYLLMTERGLFRNRAPSAPLGPDRIAGAGADGDPADTIEASQE